MRFNGDLIGFHWDLPSNGDEMGYTLWKINSSTLEITNF